MTIKAVDLFCGVGGLTYGLQKAGIPVVAGIDIDDSCEYAYTHNNNCTFIHKSVEDVTGKEIRALLRGADVKILVGCAPCQPFSSHQKDSRAAPDLPALRPDTYTPVPQTPPPTPLRRR